MPDVELTVGPPGYKGEMGFPGLDGIRGPGG